MSKYLPYIKNNSRAFTLIELLVVISIIAIISVVGIAVFQNQQKNARDARRRADIESIAQAMEAQHVAGSVTYPAMATTYFSSGKIPVDAVNTTSGATASCSGGGTACQYCFVVSGTLTACPGTGGNYINTPATAPAAWVASSTWTVCANLEGSATSICRSNAQ